VVESGADGDCEPSVIVDTATVNCSDRPSQTCHRKDFHPGDCSINVGNSLQGDIPDMVTDVTDITLEDVSASCADRDDRVCDSNKATDVKDVALEDASTSCADGDDRVCDSNKATDVKDVTLEDASTSCADGDDRVCDSNKATGVKDTTLEDVSTSCANISSAVRHMDIDVSEDAADVPGISVVTLH